MRDDGRVATNSASGWFIGPVIQAGTVQGDVHVHDTGPVRSYYLTRVESFVPPCLVDRDEELAELADFCTSPDTESRYAWWRAEAWSGKSALLSTFVLNPPRGVRLVAFTEAWRVGGCSGYRRTRSGAGYGAGCWRVGRSSRPVRMR